MTTNIKSFEEYYAEFIQDCIDAGDEIDASDYSEVTLRYHRTKFEEQYGMRRVSTKLATAFNEAQIDAMMESGAALHPWVDNFIEAYNAVDTLVMWFDVAFDRVRCSDQTLFYTEFAPKHAWVFTELRQCLLELDNALLHLMNLPYLDYEDYDYSDRIYQNNHTVTLDQMLRQTHLIFENIPKLVEAYLDLVSDAFNVSRFNLAFIPTVTPPKEYW